MNHPPTNDAQDFTASVAWIVASLVVALAAGSLLLTGQESSAVLAMQVSTVCSIVGVALVWAHGR